MNKDIFSKLDPSTSYSLMPNLTMFLMPLTLLYILLSSPFFASGLLVSLKSLMNTYLINVPKELGTGFLSANSLYPSMFTLVFFINLLGLVPYSFGVTTSIMFNLSMALVFWLSMNLSKTSYSWVSFMSHLTPEGAPMVLVPLLKVMELISKLMRFLTLALRLTINMMTGHMLLTLLAGGLTVSLLSGSLITSTVITVLQSGYLVFELAVCFLQSYVFSLLLYQYLLEHTTA